MCADPGARTPIGASGNLVCFRQEPRLLLLALLFKNINNMDTLCVKMIDLIVATMNFAQKNNLTGRHILPSLHQTSR